jgi:hypothetical protein
MCPIFVVHLCVLMNEVSLNWMKSLQGNLGCLKSKLWSMNMASLLVRMLGGFLVLLGSMWDRKYQLLVLIGAHWRLVDPKIKDATWDGIKIFLACDSFSRSLFTVWTLHPSTMHAGHPIGRKHCEVVIRFVIKRDAKLPRPYPGVQVMADAKDRDWIRE